MNRRHLLGGAAAAAALGALGRSARAAAPTVRVAPRGHRVVVLAAWGGFDSVMTVDPKDARLVGGRIDPGYHYDRCIKVGGRMFGPGLAPLGRHAARLATLRGVRIDTVAHEYGASQLLQGHSVARDGARTIWATIADHLPGGPDAVPVLALPTRCFLRASPIGFPGTNFKGSVDPRLSEFIEAAADMYGTIHGDAFRAPSWFDAMAAEQVADARTRLSPDDVAARERNDRTAKTLHGLFASTTDLDRYGDDIHAQAFRVCYAGLMTGAAKVTFVMSPDLWFDTHSDHIATQTLRIGGAMRVLRAFLDDLDATPVEGGGTLADQTTIVLATEIGRYPTINGNAGKDHWPEASFFMLGKGVKPVTIGGTGDDYRALLVDHRTGSTVDGERKPLFVQALSSTLLRIVGAAPSSAGFSDDDVLQPILG